MLFRLSLLLCFTVRVESLRRKSNSSASIWFGTTARVLWDEYVQGVQDTYRPYGGIQSGCVPQRHSNQGAYRGTITLFHGFTACPQQFDYLVPFLTSAGYTVLTPLNPGHGMALDSRGKDQYDLMPTDPSKYADFGHTMDSIMQQAGGEKILFGLSLGGSIASYTGKLSRYTRRFIAVPLVRMAGVLDTVVSVVGSCDCVGNVPVGWGEACQREREAGRAGICWFNPAIAGAARAFGQEHLESVTSTDQGQAKFGAMQFVFVQDDGAVSTDGVRELASKFGIGSDSKYICGLDAPIGHSFLSPYDSPSQNKYWLNEMTDKIVDYLTAGKSMPQDTSLIEGARRCDVRCDAQSCPYSGVASIHVPQ